MSDGSREPWRTKEMQSLFEAICDLGTAAEAQAFLRDLCTMSELEAMAHRWQVAELVDAGLPYLEVAARSGASTTTVTRVANSLRYGQDGYRLALDRQAASTHASATEEQTSQPATPQARPSGKTSTSRADRKELPVAPRTGARRRTSQSVSTRRRGARPAPGSG